MEKSTFTIDEYNELKILISKKVVADTSGQKRIREQIRKLGFHFSKFSSSKSGYDVNDLESLVRSGQITIQQELKALEQEPIVSEVNPKSAETTFTSSVSLNDPFEMHYFVTFINYLLRYLDKMDYIVSK